MKKLLSVHSHIEELELNKENDFYLNEEYSGEKFLQFNNLPSIKIIEEIMKVSTTNKENPNNYLLRVINLFNKRCDDNLKINILFGNGVSINSGSKSTKSNYFSRWFNGEEIKEKWVNILKIMEEESFLGRFLKNLINIANQSSNIEELFNYLLISLEYLKNNYTLDERVNEVYDVLEELIFSGKNSLLNDWLYFALGDIDYSLNNLKDMSVFIRTLFQMKKKDINIFTLNYDLIVESVCDKYELNLNTGFKGVNRKRFNIFEFYTDRVFRRSDGKSDNLKKINFFKLHGSINWVYDKTEEVVIEKQINFNEDNKIEEIFPNLSLITPSRNKLTDSLNAPFGELQRIFKEKISTEKNLLIIIGYSFGDEHLNRFINDSIEKNEELELIIFIYGEYEKNNNKFLNDIEEKIKQKHKITIIYSEVFSDFSFISRNMIGSHIFYEYEANLDKQDLTDKEIEEIYS